MVIKMRVIEVRVNNIKLKKEEKLYFNTYLTNEECIHDYVHSKMGKKYELLDWQVLGA